MYGNDKQLIQTFSPYKIYQYSDAMLKYFLKKKLKKQFSITKNQFI